MTETFSEPSRGLAIHAVVRNRRTERALDAMQTRGSEPGYELIESGELAAVVTESDFAHASPATTAVTEHARIVAGLLRRSSLVPVPFGLRARDDGAVKAFLDRQRVPLLEALDYLDDCYEVRVHITARQSADAWDRLASMSHHVYEELQRQAKAARILAEGERGHVLSAAFLIPRSEWIGFVEYVSDWEARYSAVRMDVTGPWAAYDFVHLMPSEATDGTDTAADG
jgi:hypothetical protein